MKSKKPVKSLTSRLPLLSNPRFQAFYQKNLPWLDVIALLLWGILFLKYRLTGKLALLIHPNYFILVVMTGIIFLGIAGIKTWQINLKKRKKYTADDLEQEVQHITLFPPGFSMILLITVGICGLLIPPRILASDTAIQRGITESLPYTRTQTQSFYNETKPEERTLMDWVKTLNAYPEPDAYTGQPVNVTGFVVHLPTLPDNYFLIARFAITCCAVDAYPVGLPVQLEGTRDDFKADSWLEIKGEMLTEELNNSRKLVIKAKEINTIPTPADPYEFN